MILINNAETQLIKKFLCVTLCAYSFKKYTGLKKIIFFIKLFGIFYFKIDSITLDPDRDPNPNWAKILDPDPNSMYLDPQHCQLSSPSFSFF